MQFLEQILRALNRFLMIKFQCCINPNEEVCKT